MRPLDTSKLPEPPVELTPVRGGSWSAPVSLETTVIGSIPYERCTFFLSQTCICSKAKLVSESSESMFDFDKKP